MVVGSERSSYYSPPYFSGLSYRRVRLIFSFVVLLPFDWYSRTAGQRQFIEPRDASVFARQDQY